MSLLTFCGWPGLLRPVATASEPAGIEEIRLPAADVTVSHPVRLVHRPGAEIVSIPLEDGTDAFVYTGGFYAYQRREATRRDEPEEYLLELRADNAVVFYDQQELFAGDPNIHGVYLEGDVTLMANAQQITAEQLYYDFRRDAALILQGTLRLEDAEQNQGIYLRAEEIRRLSENHFRARDVQISTDAFYKPHVAAGVGQIDAQRIDGLYHFDMRNFTANVEGLPVFWWPRMKSVGVMPETPLKAFRAGTNSIDGVSIETEWQLDRLLNLPALEGVEPVWKLGGYTKRGPVTGIDVDYLRENYYGLWRSEIVHDEGEDRLSRFPSRRNVEPEHDWRGRVLWQHRHYLPEDWQLTAEFSYLSDPTYLESWEEKEFDTDKEQETLLYLKQQRDNWAFDLINKFQINDFEPTFTELPTAGFHVAGQDLFEFFTYQQDSQISHMNERLEDYDVPGFDGVLEPSILPPTIDESDFTFGFSRHELSLPLALGPVKFVPTAIGMAVFDDSPSGPVDRNSFHQSAVGFRLGTQVWHVDRSVKSRLWNLDGLRHIVVPEFSAFWVESDEPDVSEQDVFNVALRQRWQTKRGLPGQKHNVDVFRFDTSLTMVSNDVDDTTIPQQFFFSHPDRIIGKAAWINPDLANLGLARREQLNQTLADHISAEAEWLISDQTVVSAAANYNLNDAQLSQTDFTLAMQRSPRLAYFFGSRFLNEGNVREDKTLDVFEPVDGLFLNGGLSYQLNRKYTVAVANQFDLENHGAVNTQLVLIRRFPQWFGAVSAGFDQSRESFSLSFTIWPQALGDVAIGTRRYRNIPASPTPR